MRDLERKIEKLEQSNKFNGVEREEILKLLDEVDLHPLDKIKILVELGLLDGKTIVRWIVEGSQVEKE